MQKCNYKIKNYITRHIKSTHPIWYFYREAFRFLQLNFSYRYEVVGIRVHEVQTLVPIWMVCPIVVHWNSSVLKSLKPEVSDSHG